MTVEVAETESLLLAVSEAEREALLRVLYVVKDNFWLDDVEEAMLERLLEPLAKSDRSSGISAPMRSGAGMTMPAPYAARRRRESDYRTNAVLREDETHSYEPR